MRTRIRRFTRSLKPIPSTAKHNQTLPIPIRVGQGPLKNRRLRDPPVRTTRHPPLIRKIRAYPKRPQHAHPRARSLPFLPTNLSHPTPKPLIQGRELLRRCRQTKIAHPTPNKPIQHRNAIVHRHTPPPRRQRPNPVLHALKRLRSNPDFHTTRSEIEAESQQSSYIRRIDHGLLSIDLQLQIPFKHFRCLIKDPPSRSLRLHKNSDVIGVPDEPVPTTPELLIEIIKHDIRQQRR